MLAKKNENQRQQVIGNALQDTWKQHSMISKSGSTDRYHTRKRRVAKLKSSKAVFDNT